MDTLFINHCHCYRFHWMFKWILINFQKGNTKIGRIKIRKTNRIRLNFQIFLSTKHDFYWYYYTLYRYFEYYSTKRLNIK